MNERKIQKVLFFRDFKGFTGGHLKVWNYFNHFIAKGYDPYISFSENSLWDVSNPWLLTKKDKRLSAIGEIEPDILFLAGMDWQRKHEVTQYPESKPIINLIQHVRHSQPNTPLYSFLKNKAVRICVSEQVAEAITQTKQVNGPIFVIPNGIDLQHLPQTIPFENRPIDIVISGLKQGQLAQRLHEELAPLNKNIIVLTEFILQSEYLDLISQTKIAVFLPNVHEGFYLPPLEAMSMETLVVCPDCIGNRSFCLPDYNCLRPKYTFQDILNALYIALSLSGKDKQRLLSNAKNTALSHDLEIEQKAFYDILDKLEHIW